MATDASRAAARGGRRGRRRRVRGPVHTRRAGRTHRLGRELDPIEKVTALTHGAGFVFAEAAGIAAELGPTASFHDGAQAYLDRHGLDGDVRRQAELMMRSLSELSENYPWTKLSLDQVVRRDPLYPGGLGVWPVGGYARLCDAMAGPEPVRLSPKSTRSSDRAAA